MKTRIRLQPLVFLSLLVLASCTRKSDETSTVSFTLPVSSKVLKSQSFSAQSLNKVSSQGSSSDSGFYAAINITSSVGNIFCSYDSHDNLIVGPCQFNIPEVVILVPQAKDTLFQVIFAMDSSSGTQMNYGEAKKDISGTATTVELGLSKIGASATNMAKIEARIIGGTTQTPVTSTGLVRLKYKPNTGSPAMTIMESEIFAGWAKLFTIENVKMTYEVDGQPLFPEYPSGLEFSDFQTLVNRATPINAANDADMVLRNGSTSEWTIGGFLGAGVDSAIYSTSTTAGGCSGSHYSSCLEVLSSGASPFSGPFRPNASQNYFTLSANWNLTYLPGISTSDIDGVKLFKISINNIEELKPYSAGDRRWNCAKLKEVGTEVATISFPSSNFSPPNLQPSEALFACPFKGERYFTSAVAYPEYINNFNRSGYQGPYLHLNVEGVEGGFQDQIVNIVATNNCYKAKIGLYEGQGSSLTNNSGSPLTISLNQTGSTGLQYYSDSSCSTAISTVDIADTNSQTSDFYFKTSTEGLGTIKYTEATHPGTNIDIQALKPGLKIFGPTALSVGECIEIRVAQTLAGKPLSVPSFSSSLNLVFDLSSGLSLYTDSYCAGTSVSSHSIGTSNAVTYGLYVKKTATGSDLIQLNSTTHSSTHQLQSLTITDRAGSTTADRVKIELVDPSPYYVGQCYAAKATLVNSIGEPTPTLASINLSFNSNSGDFYYSCPSYEPLHNLYFNQGEVSRIVFFKPSVTGALTSAGTISNAIFSSISFAGSVNISAPISTSSYVRIASAPSFTSKIIGSHEFGTQRAILLDYPANAEIEASCATQVNPYDPLNWGNCTNSTFNSQTKTFNWSVLDATANTSFRFRARISGSSETEVIFNPSSYYGIGTASPFEVLHCDTTLPASGTVVTGAQIPSSGVTCINQGATLDTSSNTVSLTASGAGVPSLVGWAGSSSDGSQRTVLTTPNTSGSSFNLSLTASTPNAAKIRFANMILASTASNSAVMVNTSNPANPASIKITNLLVKSPTSGSSTPALYVHDIASNSNVAIEDTDLELYDSYTGLKVYNSSISNMMGAVSVVNMKVLNPTTSPNVKAIHSVSSPSGSNNIWINGFKLQGSGVALDSSDNSASHNSNISVQNCNIDSNGTLAQAPITIANAKLNFYLTNCKIKTSGTGRPTISFGDASVASGQLAVKGNVFIKNENTNVFEFAASSNKTTDFYMTGNSFVKTSNTAGGAVLGNAGGSSIGFSDSTGLLPASGTLGNKVCHTTGASPLSPVSEALTGSFNLPNSVAAVLLTSGACP